MAIVGLSFGRHIVELLHSTPASEFIELSAVCDIRKDLAETVGRERGVRATDSLEELLADPKIQAIGLFTGPYRRAELIRTVLHAGKDVLTTKPFELDSAEAEQILREAQQLGRTIHLNSPSPEPTADIRQVLQWRDQYDLGALVSARGDVWASYFEKSDGSWMDNPDKCPGGAMMRLGIYLINDILQLAGVPNAVSFASSRIRTGRPTPDNALLTLSFPSGCLGSIHTSFCVRDGDQYGNGLSLHFERGSIYRNVGSERAVARPERAQLSLVRLDGDSRVVEVASFDECSGVYQWEEFYRALTLRESISEEYINRIVAGVRVLESLRHLTVRRDRSPATSPVEAVAV
ncbi:predicted dehydrogenase [Terrimicrobium sacchariphilum]|uniref:Predicted dehydrogenase n=2 Tax=Terrimicrobium sacchariphilum TaxID=690879 RepID=A0A146G569_TERSA|nr:predicted dehydrogenase [Terrimicrobium sacchariphilum]